MKQELKEAKEANKRVLDSITVEDILKEEKLDNDDLKARAESADSFYTAHFNKILKLMVYKELERLGKEMNTAEELLFSRGIIHGFGLMQDWFEEQVSISREKSQERLSEKEE